jgi:hypothetical protein
VRGILSRFGPSGALVLLESVPVYMARLAGATGHTAEEANDPTRLVVYLDPFRASGRLHAVATLLHELKHVERYRERGFHANRAAAALPRQDFVLLGLADEFAAYEAEAALVRSFLENEENREARRAVPAAMRIPELRWPPALTAMLGFGNTSGEAARATEARRQVIADLARIAGDYWDARHRGSLDPRLRQTIREWYERSREWQEIAAQRPAWSAAEGAPAARDR